MCILMVSFLYFTNTSCLDVAFFKRVCVYTVCNAGGVMGEQL